MNILVINPSSSDATNEIIFRAATNAAKYSAGGSEEYTNISTIHIPAAPAHINSELEELTAAYHMLEKIKAIGSSYDGFLICCHNDPGIAALRELTKKPVVGIGYASLYHALPYEGAIGILATSETSALRKQKLIRKYGFSHHPFIVIPVALKANMPLKEREDTICQACTEAKATQGCRAFILGCVGLSDLATQLALKCKCPMIDGIASGVHLLERWIRSESSFS